MHISKAGGIDLLAKCFQSHPERRCMGGAYVFSFGLAGCNHI